MTSSKDDFSPHYESFDEQEKKYLNIMCIIPQANYMPGIVQIFHEISAPGEKINPNDHFSNQAIAAEIERIKKRLKKQDILDQDGYIKVEYLHPFTIECLKVPHFRKISTMADMLQQRYPYFFRFGEQNKLRLAIYTNDELLYKTMGHRLNHADFIETIKQYFFTETIPFDWIQTRSLIFQSQIFDLHFYGFYYYNHYLENTQNIVQHYLGFRHKIGHEYVPFIYHIIHHDSFFLKLTPLNEAEFSKPIPNLPLIGEFLDGRSVHTFLASETHSKSFEWFEIALKTIRRETSKKKVKLSPISSYFYCLSLLEKKSAESFRKVKDICEQDNPESPHYDLVLEAILNVSYLLQGLRSKIKFSEKRALTDLPPIDSAIIALCMYWADTDKITLKTCQQLFDCYKDKLPLIGKIVADVLIELDPNNQECQNYLTQEQFKNIITFTKILEISEGWQLALDNLETFFGGGTLEETQKEKRLAWVYDIKKREMADILEQSYVKGKWSKGKSLTLKRLCEHDKLPYITPNDQRVIKAIKREKYWSNQYSYEWDRIKMQMALVGHPTIYNAARLSDLLEITSGRPELVIKQLDEQNFHLSLSHFSAKEVIFTESEGPNRIRFVHFEENLLPLSEILGQDGIKVPAKAKNHIIAIVQKAGLMLPIHSDVADIDIQAQEGDTTPCLHLQPLGDNEYGLELHLLVRPFGNKGPYYRPGLGRAAIQMIEHMQPIKAKRNLEAEKEAAQTLLDHCSILKQSDNGTFEWQLDDPYECLETLAELKDYEEKHNNGDEPVVRIEWPKGKKINLTEPLNFNKMRLNIKQSKDWFHVDGEIEIDKDTVLNLKEVLALLDQSKGRFIQLDDRKYIALTNGLKKQLQELKFFGETEKEGGFKVHTLGIQTLKAFSDQVEHLTVDAEWKKRVSAYDHSQDFNPVLPKTLQADLREYQKEGFEWMARLGHTGMGACLADDMGLGKTVQSLAVLLTCASKGPCLVIAPTSVCHNWHEEIKKFAPTLNARAFDLTGREDVVQDLGPMDVLICSYTLLQQEAALLASKKFEMIILDEAQAIKNAATKRFQAAIQLNGHFKLALSGTPIENNLEELWSLFRFITPGLLGSRESFNKRFLSSTEKDQEQARRQALKNLIKFFILRRTKSNVLQELPPKTEQTIHIDMAPEEKAFYEAVRQTAIENIANLESTPGTRKIHILAELTRLRRVCCHPQLVDSGISIASSKIKVFLELVDELLKNNHKALIFSQYVGYLDIIRKELDKLNIDYQYLDGSTPAGERQKRVNAFQAGQASLFLLSLKAGGAGLNLTAADYVVHMDPWWNPAVEDQASDRAHRMGQQRPVTIYRLVMKDSIEERILSLHADKRELADDLLAGSSTAQKLSELDLMKLLAPES